jgi:hypothetical protein
MSEKPPEAYGIPLDHWAAAFRAGMPEFAANNFVFTREAAEQVRIAFGNSGPYVDPQGTRSPVFTHAVTITPQIAVELARLLLKHYAAPETAKSETSGEV